MSTTPGLLLRGAVALALAVVAVLCARHGVVVRPSTGGLLVAPVPTVRILGAWITLAVVAGTAAVLVAVSAGHHRRHRGAAPHDTLAGGLGG